MSAADAADTVLRVAIDEDEGTRWLADAPAGRPVSIVGHNTLAVALTGLLDLYTEPARLLQPVTSGGTAMTPTFPRTAPGPDGIPLLGTANPGSRLTRLAEMPNHVEEEMDLYRGALGWALVRMHESAVRLPEEPRAGQLGVLELAAVVVVALVGFGSVAYIATSTHAARVHEEQETARRIAAINAAAADRVRDLQVFRATGTMPAPSPLQMAAAEAIRPVADDFWKDARSTGVKLAAVMAGLYGVKRIFFPG